MVVYDGIRKSICTWYYKKCHVDNTCLFTKLENMELFSLEFAAFFVQKKNDSYLYLPFQRDLLILPVLK